MKPNNGIKKKLRFFAGNAATLLLMLLLVGCRSLPIPHYHAERLMSRPDFQSARMAAPEWCRDALKTINELQYELERN